MPVDLMFVLATAAFAWGVSLATYRWFAVQNEWPMGEWQAHRPVLPLTIGLVTVAMAVLFALARGDATVLVVPLLGLLCAWIWTAILKVGAQSALLLAPLAVVALMFAWMAAASSVTTADDAGYRSGITRAGAGSGLINERDRAINLPGQPQGGINRGFPQR